jgi:hypothetical protein
MGPKPHLSPVRIGQLLIDQPSPAGIERGAQFASETDIPNGERRTGVEFAIEPGRGVGPREPVKRRRRQHLDHHGGLANPARFIGRGPVEMVHGDGPGPVRVALDADAARRIASSRRTCVSANRWVALPSCRRCASTE